MDDVKEAEIVYEENEDTKNFEDIKVIKEPDTLASIIAARTLNILKTVYACILSAYEIFMMLDPLRIVVAFVLQILLLLISVFGIICCWAGNTNKTPEYWWTIIGLIVLSIIIIKISRRIAVTRVCPQCDENRAVKKTETETGNIQYGIVRKTKEHKMQQEQRKEYKITKECIYQCGYYEEEFVWESKWIDID